MEGEEEHLEVEVYSCGCCRQLYSMKYSSLSNSSTCSLVAVDSEVGLCLVFSACTD